MSQFQLFPSPPAARVGTNPFRRGAKRPPGMEEQPTSSVALHEINESTKAESVLLQIIEDTSSFPRPPSRTHHARSGSPSSTEVLRKATSSHTPRSQSRQDSRPVDRPLPLRASTDNDRGSTSEISRQNTISTASPQSSQSSVSPIPMKSMFPRFDPKLPLPRSIAQPPLSSNVEAQKRRSRKPLLTLNTSSEIDNVLGPKTVPASVLNFPNGIADSEEIRYSTPYELEVLWEAANGQRPTNLAGTFSMHLARTGPATFKFGHLQQPFYTLETFENDELSISRGVPSKVNSNVPVMSLNLEDRRRREHPHDGLVALLFSRLAAMLAIEQAGDIAKLHLLNPVEAAGVQRDALNRASAQESCRLSWNRNLRLYELRHPQVAKRQPPALVGAEGIPLSPVRSSSSGVLYITVSAPSSDVVPQQAPTILVTNPASSAALATAHQAANPRTSTLPMADSDEPLVCLDLTTRTLTISPAAIIATIPSLYAIDSVIAAVLAVAVSDEATNPILADMEVESPTPNAQDPRSGGGVGIPYRGPLITTQAEREDYAESLQLASQIQAAKDQAESNPERKSFFGLWKTHRAPKSDHVRNGKKDNEIVIEEIDLEKYGRYGKGSSREGEKLPGIVRTVLKLMFLGLSLIIKGMTLLVKLLAWLLVRSTRCVTSDKF
ncbi:Uncharacterized protein PECH_005684 [Penicillium ucsense]|uniref:Uncharacterized protein n=1 Tax=Penicillium ucsense TaxID=2839758 RepID=A0A8J8WMA5_9EURO|nr:Uncharacterized protein PECM_004535 [Penicillium ucsense]KAF7736202.1 Uncharacterized protein PECH_005684 [Penicillium ucsense]